MASRLSDERAESRAEIPSSAAAADRSAAADEAPANDELESHFRLRRVLRGTSAMFVSTLVHMTAFIVLSLLWGWGFDGTRPDKFDAIGCLLCLVGVAVIMYWPRT